MAKYTPVKIAYKTFEPVGGSNDKLAPIIFTHGSSCSKEIWDDLPQRIADATKRKAYAIDARCHGESESSEHFSFEVNVDDLFHFMDGLNIERAVLIGQSMGATAVIRAALRKPERVEMMFSEDMYAKKIPASVVESISQTEELWSEIVQSMPKDLNEQEAFNRSVDILYEKHKGSAAFSSKEALKKSKLRLKRKPDGRYDVAYDKEPMIRAYQNPDTLMTDPSGVYNGPAYFLCGLSSPFDVRSEEANIKKHFPKAELIDFPGASHNLHVEFPDKFVKTVVSRMLQ